jgi:hypothetical protein
MGELVGGEFVGWPEPDSFGGIRNPAGIWMNLVEIQEFLSRRNSCKNIL